MFNKNNFLYFGSSSSESSLKSLLSPLPTLSGVRAPRQSPKAERELIFFPQRLNKRTNKNSLKTVSIFSGLSHAPRLLVSQDSNHTDNFQEAPCMKMVQTSKMDYFSWKISGKKNNSFGSCLLNGLNFDFLKTCPADISFRQH